MRLLADMGFSPDTVSWLRSQSHGAVHLHEQGWDRISDSEILKKARAEGMVLLTHDFDFGQLLALSREISPSVTVFRLADMRPDSVNRHLDLCLATGRARAGSRSARLRAGGPDPRAHAADLKDGKTRWIAAIGVLLYG